MLTDSAFISRLIEILRASPPRLQVKAAYILEYIVTLETNVEAVTAAGIGVALNDILRKGSMNGT